MQVQDSVTRWQLYSEFNQKEPVAWAVGNWQGSVDQPVAYLGRFLQYLIVLKFHTTAGGFISVGC